ncbi:helix-turn-helix transcriptional regulator [Flavobacterium branchiicola]|uniref:Helix-turn-helix transcriptional regulator n=1 Tax=Flavobacterium branchiicola TaxID=1114875 RepID=A0ABV9PBS0_9FLAO|nr:helix-turn-helix transcriptional regulator [Flavobacterium branchiicola]MBS7253605.1 helix-turn-helix transcriptional regulator [Flavobacterium branchiicola]
MKKIIHHFGVELDWVEPFASALEGKVEGNFIMVPDHIHTGQRYFLNLGFGISALYLDVVYTSEILFRMENKTDDFLGLYYNLTEGDAILMADDVENPIGRWNYNLGIIDSTLSSDYIVKAGTESFALCIFMKKDTIKEYFQNNPSLKDHADEILNPKLNTIIKFTRMSIDSYNLLMNLRNQEVGGMAFDLYLRGTVQNLIAEYIEKMTFEEIVIDKINDDDLRFIIKSQSYLVDNVDQLFPSIEFLAQQINMSESKYKKLFKKITGMTPNSFFLTNKLLKAKRLLQERQLNIAQISDTLSFTNSSYFAAKFKEFFGMSPKDFVKQLE